LTFGLGIIILQGVSKRKSLAGVNIMDMLTFQKSQQIKILKARPTNISEKPINKNFKSQAC
jgi:hypothetical protein